MGNKRPSVGKKLKQQLLDEAGGKCANPGCPNVRVHYHHIKEWAVHKTHDGTHMIAVCPVCHDAIHFGQIPFDDDLLLAWKQLSRGDNYERGHLYVEPMASTSSHPKLLLGSLAVSTDGATMVFELSERHRLGFELRHLEIFLLNLSVANLAGDEVLLVQDNHVRHRRRPEIAFHQAPGAVFVTAPTTSEFIEDWMLDMMRKFDPGFGATNLTLLELRVLKPGLVQVKGLWASEARAVVATEQALSFIHPGLDRPLSLIGAGVDSVLHHATNGRLDRSLFGFNEDSTLKLGRSPMKRGGGEP